jgi:hypothetical protein
VLCNIEHDPVRILELALEISLPLVAEIEEKRSAGRLDACLRFFEVSAGCIAATRGCDRNAVDRSSKLDNLNSIQNPDDLIQLESATFAGFLPRSAPGDAKLIRRIDSRAHRHRVLQATSGVAR